MSRRDTQRGRKRKTGRKDRHSVIERVSERGSRMREKRDGTREGERK